MTSIDLTAEGQETVETGDLESNKEFAQYPLTVEKVAMLESATNKRSVRGKNEMEGHGMLSAGKKFH
jgi:hypothetical protein